MKCTQCIKSEFKEDKDSILCNPAQEKNSTQDILLLILKGELDMAIKIIHQMQECMHKEIKPGENKETSSILPDALPTKG